jgi:adenosylcobinamide-GDP ribazoletransferase
MKLFLLALQFLTIIRVPFDLDIKEEDLGKSMAFFTLVGLVIGLILVDIRYVLVIILPPSITDILIIASLTVIAGSLHLDGFADVIDGLAGGKDRERTLAIMKDSRIGSFAVVGLILILILKVFGLMSVPEGIKSGALVVMPVLGRWSTVQLASWFEYARSGYGTGLAFTNSVGKKEYIISTVVAAVVAVGFLHIRGLIILFAVGLFTFLFGLFFKKRIGGVTGDVMGAGCELNEVIVLLMICALFT